MFGLLAIILIVAAIIWLICQFVPASPLVAKIALCVWVIVATLMLIGVAA